MLRDSPDTVLQRCPSPERHCTMYFSGARPPSSAGDAQFRVNDPSPALTTTSAGGPGGRTGGEVCAQAPGAHRTPNARSRAAARNRPRQRGLDAASRKTGRRKRPTPQCSRPCSDRRLPRILPPQEASPCLPVVRENRTRKFSFHSIHNFTRRRKPLSRIGENGSVSVRHYRADGEAPNPSSRIMSRATRCGPSGAAVRIPGEMARPRFRKSNWDTTPRIPEKGVIPAVSIPGSSQR